MMDYLHRATPISVPRPGKFQGWQVFAKQWKKTVFSTGWQKPFFSMVKTGLAKIVFASKNRFLPAKIGF